MYIHFNSPQTPIIDEDKEAIAIHKGGLYCNNRMHFFICTRLKNHTGMHVAGGMTDIYAVWDRDEPGSYE